jgi:dihydrofolate reductase
MPLFHAIAAMSENRVIGNQGKIPWHIPDDFRWFKHKTMGGTLIMGRKTFESIGKPLPGRKTIVLTRQSLNLPDVETCPDATALKKRLSDRVASQLSAGTHTRLPANQEPPARIVPWVCGGAEIYRLFLPQCSTLHLTRIKREVKGDTFFPEFENDFSLEQVIHENQSFRVERWVRKGGTHYTFNEAWPFEAGGKQT